MQMSIINRSTVKKSKRHRRQFEELHTLEKRDLKFGEMSIKSKRNAHDEENRLVDHSIIKEEDFDQNPSDDDEQNYLTESQETQRYRH